MYRDVAFANCVAASVRAARRELACSTFRSASARMSAIVAVVSPRKL